MQEPIVESHPFAALLPPQATVMMMGTFPPKEEKHAMQFHYPNFQNDMWRVSVWCSLMIKNILEKGKKKHLMRKD